jgi:signal transduction histidine kinase
MKRQTPAIAGACALTAGAVAVALTSASPDERAVAVIAHGLLVATPAGVGLVVLARRPGDRFAHLLLASAALWALTSLVLTSGALSYSIGRIANWVVEAMVVYLLLAFPSGRLTTALDRRVFGAVVLVVGLLFLPTALVVAGYPQPLEGHSCVPDCPANAFALTSSEPAIVEDLIRPLRETITVLIFFVVVGIVVRRTLRAGPMRRPALVPVAVAAAARALVYPVFFAIRSGNPDAAALTTVYWAYLLVLPLIPLSFGAGLFVMRLYGALALQRMALRLPPDAGIDELEPAMAAALEDPSLHIARDAAAPTIDHDAGLAQDPDVMRAAGAYTVILLENRRLVDELRASVSELSASRARIAVVGDEARRRIERDLHDGAQQRLVALRLKLARQSDRLAATAPETSAVLAGLGHDAEHTIDDVRALAHGIYPSLLADRGLPDALRAAALGASISTSLAADGIGRYPRDVESSVYFACLEALQNAAKHARGVTHVEITLAEHDALEFEVSDDGEGFDLAAVNGGGLTNLRDRLTAVGGELHVTSRPGHGTRVGGSVPVG